MTNPLAGVRAALASRDTDRVNIGLLGASLAEGYPAPFDLTIEQQLAARLRVRFPTSGLGTGGGVGYVPIPSAPVKGTVTTPISWSAGTYHPTFGWGGNHGVWYTTPAQNAVLTLTLPADATQVVVGILVGPTGHATGGRYRINGGSWVTFSTLGGVLAGADVTITQAFSASDTIEIGYNAGTGNVVVTGFVISDGDESKGIQVHNFGHSGFRVSDWMAGAGGDPQWDVVVAGMDLDLLVLQDFGFNDGNAAGSSPIGAAAFKTAFGSMIDRIRTTGHSGDILLMAAHNCESVVTFVDPWDDYVTAIRELAQEKGCGFIQADQYLPASPAPIYDADDIHGNVDGSAYAAMAELIFNAITPEGRALTYELNRLAGTLDNGVPTLEAQGAANAWAGTSGLALVGALNVKAGNALPGYRELQGVLNQLAGTSGLGPDRAASLIA